jgi:hypothetical protein
MTTRTRKPRTKPARSCKLYDGNPGLLCLTVGKETLEYWLTAHEVPGTYRVRKVLPETDCYDIDLAAGTCDCPGCTRWGHCKHLDAVRALKAAGRLAA